MAEATIKVRERFGDLAQRITDGDSAALRDLQRLVGSLAASGDASDVAWVRLGLSQLAAEEAVSPDPLLSLDAVLEATQLELRSRRVQATRHEQRRTLRERVLDEVVNHGPMRPKSLASACDSDAYQVSRALRGLLAEGLVELQDAPDGSDGRGLWYGATASDTQDPPARHDFALAWRPARGSVPRGVFVSAIANDVEVWSAAAACDPVHVIEELAKWWIHLVLEEDLPGGLVPSNLDAVSTSSEALSEFARRHDLAQLTGLTDASPLWLVREGDSYWLLTKSNALRESVDEVLAAVSRFGDGLVEFLADVAHPRHLELRDVWVNRANRSVEVQVAVATTRPVDELEVLVGDSSWQDFWESTSDCRPSELMALGRMTSGLAVPEVREILAAVRAVAPVDTPMLDRLSVVATEHLETISHLRPYEQGQQLASWLSKSLAREESAPLDIEQLLTDWAIPVVQATTARVVDGFACWGPRHGPMVGVNTEGVHSQSPAGRRMTLAHEVAHLLVDRSSTLPLAEVLGGNSPPLVEARAGAFAAELLLPRSVAGRRMSLTAHPQREVQSIAHDFGVSYEVIAWQTRNSGFDLSSETWSYLRTLVPRHRGF